MKHGNRAAQVHQRVQLDGGLGADENAPRERGSGTGRWSWSQRVGSCVESDAKGFARIELRACGDERLGKVRLDAPVARLVPRMNGSLPLPAN